MKSIREAAHIVTRPIRIVQFGEGNFLRAFADYMIDIANEQGLMDAGIAVVKPIAAGNLDAFREQGCLYTVCLRGKKSGEIVNESRVVTSVQTVLDASEDYKAVMALAELPELEFVISNTTEAGIAFDETDCYSAEPPAAYPGKLTKFLYKEETMNFAVSVFGRSENPFVKHALLAGIIKM